ncbi:MAG: queuosine precursor transporter, partial [Holosporales bacterium]|nr:queuosine precursor transporter [Holosporales bacterium]
HSAPPEAISLLILIVSLAFLKLLHKLAGKTGLCVYNSIAVCLANIQVLHITKYSLLPSALPLGTVLFTTTFLSNTMLSSKYGKQEATRCIYLTFVVYTFFAFSLIISLMHKPFFLAEDPFTQQAYLNYQAMARLFTPSLRLLCASLAAFLASQFCNVCFFEKMRHSAHCAVAKAAGAISVLASSIIDNVVFSMLAFYVWSPVPASINVILQGYVLETLAVRCIVILVFTMVFRIRDI